MHPYPTKSEISTAWQAELARHPMNPTTHTIVTDQPLLETVVWLRFRADEARKELDQTSDPEMRRYLTARANQADNEATAREQAMREWVRA